jgi:predicted Ser/Thr protein kinase
MKRTICDRCGLSVKNPDAFILLGYNGDLCSDCFEGLINFVEIAKQETIKLYITNKLIRIEL